MIDPFLSAAGLPTTSDILDWVTGDPEALRNAAAGWTAAAAKVKDSRDDMATGMTAIADNWSGDAYQSFVNYMNNVLKEFDRQSDAMVAVANKLSSISNSLVVARDKVVRILVRLAAALIPLAAIAIFPPLGAVVMAGGIALTAAAFASIIVITQALSGVLQGIPDVLNDVKGLEFNPSQVGSMPTAPKNGVPVGKWGPHQDSPTGGTPPHLATPGGGGGSGAPATQSAPGGSGGGGGGAPIAPVQHAPAATPAQASVPAARAGEAQAVLLPGAGEGQAVLLPGAGLASGLPRGYGWTPPHAPLPAGWHQDAKTGQILPPGESGHEPAPAGLLHGCGWIAPDTKLPPGWHIDHTTDVLVGPDPTGVEDGINVSSGWEAGTRPGGSAFAPVQHAAFDSVPV